ncbi:hypothetical protein CS022_23740 [Veronia nyctiphanis]|uniref:Uncharacterized protein n=1 Tax=Veronia nyctiphanis TaxID=1278244 RepID=A0A4Q0YFZ1_9GAMM|nr:HEAT repeat domain-containing protein [Veronia nyctiphanis]RXJ69490.1 hypothetical protein CS022_23740 [Veronia nyctiphanis]
MKKITITFVVGLFIIIGFSASFLINSNSSNEAKTALSLELNSNSKNTTSESYDEKLIGDFSDDQIVYINNFSMKMGLAENIAHSQSNQLTFKLAFKPLEDSFYLGMAYDLKPIFTNSDSILINADIKQLGFTLRRRPDGKITDINMLGLPENHPYAMVEHIVSQLSFLSDGSNSRVTLKDGTYHYQYSLSAADKTTRELLEVEHHNVPEDLIKKHNESWYVIHPDSGWPTKMAFEMERDVEFQGSILAVQQTIDSKRIAEPRLTFWDEELRFANNANAGLTVPEPELNEPTIAISNQTEFYNALAMLDNALDPSLARAMGLFMINEQTPDDIMAFLMDENMPTEHHAHIIYAIQKADTPLAEEYLADIAANVDISSLNRTRAIVSSGQFKNASQTSIDSLYNLMDDTEQGIANAASLNLGTIAKKSPKHDQQIADILLNRLRKESDPYMAILSISNINNPEYDRYIEPYLKDSRFYVRAAAYSIIARRHSHQNGVLAALLSEGHPTVIDSITKTMVKYENVPVPSTFLPHLRNRINGDGPAVIASRLIKFYLALKGQFNQTDVYFLQSLLNNSRISDTDKSDIGKALGGF